MNKILKGIGVVFTLTLLVCGLSSCGKVKSAKELHKYAKKTYGECTVVSSTEDTKSTVLTVHDKLQDFDYNVSSSMQGIYIDGSSFGSVPQTSSDFDRKLDGKVISVAKDELDAVCSKYKVRMETDSFSLLVIRSNDENAAKTAASECAAILQKQNLNNRLDQRQIEAYADNEETCYHDEKYCIIILPDIKLLDKDDELILEYTQRARSQTDSEAEFIRKEEKKFSGTGADLNRVVSTLGQDYPTEQDSPVTYYYFKSSKGEEFYLCNFLYRDENSAAYYYFTNYKGEK